MSQSTYIQKREGKVSYPDQEEFAGFESEEDVAGDQAAAPQQPLTSKDLVTGLPSALFERPDKKPEEALDQNRPLVNAETLSLI